MPQHIEAPDGSIVEFPDGMNDDQISAVMRKTYAPKPKRNAYGEVAGFMANVNRGLGVGDELAAGAKTVGNIFSGKTPMQDVVPDFKRSMASQRSIEDSYTADRPKMAALARGTGMAATAAIPAGNTANLFANSSRLANMGRGAVTALGQGAAYAAVDRGSGAERLDAASRASRDPLTATVGAVGGGLSPARRSSPRQVSPEVRALAAEGIEMTPGQMAGGAVKQIEDAATSVPILGPAITGARKRGLESFNRAAVNRALKPIGETLPEGVAAGTDAVKHAGDRLSASYEKVLPEGRVQPDKRFAVEVRKIGPIAETMSEGAQKSLQDIIAKRVTNISKADGGVLSGQRFKQVEKGLDYEIARFNGSRDPDHQATVEALKIVKSSIQNAAMRQNPRFALAKKGIDRGWAELVRIENAAAKTGAEGGVFTPAQYDSAVRMGSDTVRRRGYARGEALGQDLATAGRAVLPSKVGDSGTATRGMVGLVLGGGAGVAGGPLGVAASAGGLALASKGYSPKAIAYANKILGERIAKADQAAALSGLRQLAQNDPKARELYRQVVARLMRAGAAGAAGRQSTGVEATSERFGVSGRSTDPNPYAQP